MSEEVKAVAENPILWIIAIATVSIVILQAILFRQRAVKYSREHKLMTEEEIKTVTKTGAISAIGPALAIFILAITIQGLLGGPFVLMRVGIIGSADTELRSATTGALIAGVTLGVDEIDISTYGLLFFTCAVMSAGYLIWVPIASRGLGKGLQKFLIPDNTKEQKKSSKIVTILLAVLPILIVVLMIFSYASSGISYVLVMLVACVMQFVFEKLSEKAPWLKSWGLGFSVLAAMLSSILWNVIF